jgi:tetratricopeptide (TPR) repeat protein
MIPKTKLRELIEDYCLNNLNQSEKVEFEAELIRNSDLRDEVEFENELQYALTEKDVLNLREKLSTVAQQTAAWESSFELLDGFENIAELSGTLPPEELLKVYDSLPKAHVYQHELVSNENIHEFFREQEMFDIDDDVLSDEFGDQEIHLDGLEEAILEKDILNLRDTLSKVAASVLEQCCPLEEIEQYLNGELSSQELERFEQELAVNSVLQREVQLHREMEQAVMELDIMNLRDELARLTGSETSWNVTEDQIEDYVNGELEGEDLKLFLAELNENSGLRAEVALRENVDMAIGEKDIFSLRDGLSQAKQAAESKEIRSLIPEATRITQSQWWRAGVAVALILVTIGGFMGRNMNFSSTVDDYFQAPQWAPQRSVSSDMGILQEANSHFVNGEYDKALVLYDKAINDKDEKFVFQFYKASTLQNLEKYEEAIPEYADVIRHGDNMFVEEAEWFRALCYFKLGKTEEARAQLTAIINRKGYFASDARAVLRKSKYTFR